MGAKVPLPHYHKQYDETIYGVEGVVTFTVEGRPVDIGTGESCFVPRGTVHGFDDLKQTRREGTRRRYPALLGPDFFKETAAIVNLVVLPILRSSRRSSPQRRAHHCHAQGQRDQAQRGAGKIRTDAINWDEHAEQHGQPEGGALSLHSGLSLSFFSSRLARVCLKFQNIRFVIAVPDLQISATFSSGCAWLSGSFHFPTRLAFLPLSLMHDHRSHQHESAQSVRNHSYFAYLFSSSTSAHCTSPLYDGSWIFCKPLRDGRRRCTELGLVIADGLGPCSANHSPVKQTSPDWAKRFVVIKPERSLMVNRLMAV